MLGWLIVGLGLAAAVGMKIRHRLRRRSVLIGLPAGAAVSRPHPWRLALIALYVLGPFATYVVYQDMTLDKPLWIGGLDSMIAITGCFWITGKLAPSHGEGFLGIVWALSVGGWIILTAGLAIAAEGRGVFQDVQLIVNGVREWMGGS